MVAKLLSGLVVRLFAEASVTLTITAKAPGNRRVHIPVKLTGADAKKVVAFLEKEGLL